MPAVETFWNRNPSMHQQYDVVVVGGGTAGAIAAIQAGRMGVRTLLVEKNGMLGGTTTVGGVNFPGLFHAWGKHNQGPTITQFGVGSRVLRRDRHRDVDRPLDPLAVRGLEGQRRPAGPGVRSLLRHADGLPAAGV